MRLLVSIQCKGTLHSKLIQHLHTPGCPDEFMVIEQACHPAWQAVPLPLETYPGEHVKWGSKKHPRLRNAEITSPVVAFRKAGADMCNLLEDVTLRSLWTVFPG